ncbi:MAG: sigma-54-dependent Fis family transcriptional regulator [Elusimicrobia bacterium]|nr:sigma-54-dependent Fis family transcriptional regulator [Elusimicrobiota bacterium]
MFTPKLSILVIEDDLLERKHIASHLKDHKVKFASDFDAAASKIKERNFDLCFIDLQLNENDDDYSGLKLIPLAISKGIYSVVMSGHDGGPTVARAHELGCHDFYAKGDEANSIQQVLNKFRRQQDKSKEKRLFTERFITNDPDTQSAILEALKYAPSELPILILGPSGTGKTSLAHLIHAFSLRPGPFVPINCAAYTEELLEAELFGFKKGAFTGANENRKGKLLLADEGTLFLDEIGVMSLKMQTKLLKAIEEKSFLDSLRLEEGSRLCFATEEHYRCAKQHGLDKALERFMDAIILHSLENNAKKRTHVIRELKISNWLFYQSLKRSRISNLRKRSVKSNPANNPVNVQAGLLSTKGKRDGKTNEILIPA